MSSTHLCCSAGIGYFNPTLFKSPQFIRCRMSGQTCAQPLNACHFLNLARRKTSVCDRIQTSSRALSEHLPRPSQNSVRITASSHLKEIHLNSRRTRWRLRGQSQMGEDAGDGRDELQLPTTVRAVVDVDIEHALRDD